MNRFAVAAVLALAAPAAVWPCMPRPIDYASAPEHEAQEAIVFWSQGREELVLKNDFRVKPGPKGELPAHLAWVIPVPAVPDNYGVEEIGVFKDMYETWEEYNRGEGGFGAPGGPNDGGQGGIRLLEKKAVGEYEIQPIQATGEAGSAALNQWLAKNGFGEIPKENLKYYVDRKWAWLAVRVDPAKGERTLAEKGSLRPLRISVACPEVFYPLKFSASEGAFDVNLYVITKAPWTEKVALVRNQAEALRVAQGAAHFSTKPVGSRIQVTFPDPRVTALEALGFSVQATSERFPLPVSVERIQEKAAKEGKWTRIEKPFVTKLAGRQINAGGNPIAKWAEDLRIAMK